MARRINWTIYNYALGIFNVLTDVVSRVCMCVCVVRSTDEQEHLSASPLCHRLSGLLPPGLSCPLNHLVPWIGGVRENDHSGCSEAVGKQPATFGNSTAGTELALFCANQFYHLPTVRLGQPWWLRW